MTDTDKARIEYDKDFLKWIYERMVCIHGEKDMYDYMINFKAIIDRVGSEHDKARNQAIQDCIDKLIEGGWSGDLDHNVRKLFVDLESLKTNLT